MSVGSISDDCSGVDFSLEKQAVGSRCPFHLAVFQRGCCEVSLQPVRLIAALPNATAPDLPHHKPPVLGIRVSDYLALHAPHAVVAERLSTPVDWSGQTIYMTAGRLPI